MKKKPKTKLTKFIVCSNIQLCAYTTVSAKSEKDAELKVNSLSLDTLLHNVGNGFEIDSCAVQTTK